MIEYSKKRNILKIEAEIKPLYKRNKVFFHTYSHINDGLKMMESLPDDLQPNDTQLVAWLFHDIVYDVSSHNNEEKSAKCFKNIYNEKPELFYGLSIDPEEVQNIIIDTKAHLADRSELSNLILDIDLSCLSGDYEYFLKGRLNVLKEYSPLYSNKRLLDGTIIFLNSFRNKKIFCTEYFYSKYEEEAHRNISTYYNEIKNKSISNLFGW